MLQKPTFLRHSKLSTVGENRNCGGQWKSWQNRKIGKQQRYAENIVHLAFNSNCQNILVTQDCWMLYWHWQQTQGPMTKCTLSNRTSSVLSRMPHKTNTEYYQLFTVSTTHQWSHTTVGEQFLNGTSAHNRLFCLAYIFQPQNILQAIHLISCNRNI